MITMASLPAISEKRFMAQIVKLAELLKWRIFHDRATNAPRTCPNCHTEIRLPRNDPGFPDLLMVRRGVLLAIELKKSDAEKLSNEQMAWLADLAAVERVRVATWRPSMWDRIEGILKGGS